MASAVFNAAAAAAAAAAATFISSAQNPKRSSSFISPVVCRTLIPQSNPNQLPNSTLSIAVSHLKHRRIICRSSAPSAVAHSAAAVTRFHGPCFVLDDNIDTDQIIPAEYLTLLPTKPDEYEKLGSLALCGLPSRYSRFIPDGRTKTEFPIIVAGSNFGCGSSREHAPVCLGASGVKAVVAESYARIFFRNCVATGEVFPVESEKRICDECKTGDLVTVDLERSLLVNHSTGKEYVLKPIGDAGPVIQAGGIFAYARKSGMIAPA